MNENDIDDELQSFIADTEYKTRKILRDANKRTRDNARLLAAKERVEKLKHNGTNHHNIKSGLVSSPPPSKGSSSAINSPLEKSRSFNLSSVHSKSNPPTPQKLLTTSFSSSSVKEWKGRDKIIHDAYETIKSLSPVNDKTATGGRKETQLQTAVGKSTSIHSSLTDSPFYHHQEHARPADSVIKPKQLPRQQQHNDSIGSAEPARITRRTLERDFYIMSKKRNNPAKRRHQQSKEDCEPPLELKTSVLQKKYRCDERIMKAKKRRAERLYKKLQRLRSLGGVEGAAKIDGDADSSSSTSSNEEDEEDDVRGHAIHDLLERHLADENARSLKRINEMLMNTKVNFDVKEAWAHLAQGTTDGVGGCGDVNTHNGQVQSVPYHIATKAFDNKPDMIVQDATSDAAENVTNLQITSTSSEQQQEGPIGRYICPYTEGGGELDAPLSMRIVNSNVDPYSNSIIPGHTAIGKRGIWRLVEPYVDKNPDPMFPIWPAAQDIRYPESLDISQATALFQRKSLGPKKGDCITVLSSLAFESPILAPYCYAIDKGYTTPPFAEPELVSGPIPHVDLPSKSLMENPVKSRLDTLLPPPIVILDPAASYDDWKDAPTDAEGNVYHLREANEFNEDGFRIKTFANKIEYDSTISSRVYGISESAASLNQPAITPVVMHKSEDACLEDVSRQRTAADYHYIAESDGEGTLNEPYMFTTHLSGYNSVFVSRKSVSTYREEERFFQAAKEAEQKRLDLALKMRAAEELVEERLRERIARIENSVKQESVETSIAVANVEEGCSVAVEIPTQSAETSSIPKIPCDVELPTTPPSRQHAMQSDDEQDEGGELEQLAKLLLKNTAFLKALARKLSISEEQLLQIDASASDDEDNNVTMVHSHHGADRTIKHGRDILDKEVEPVKTALHEETPDPITAAPINMPKLKLNCKRYRDDDNTHISTRGDGWKRLPRSETTIGDFTLTKRNIQRGSGKPKFKKLEDGRYFIAVNAVQELKYQPDPKQFETKPKSIFIPDLTTERLRLAKSYRQHKKAVEEESMLTMSQQQELDEILQIPVSKESEKKIEEENNASLVAVGGGGVVNDRASAEEERTRPIDNEARAVLAVKNHNLAELEQVLDAEGISVETRDQYGNTLFILACQQGNKKLSKFLLRRGANMNAQNNGGNTALHYLYEYAHTALAEYLIRKGADDSIKNTNNCTVYEGIDAFGIVKASKTN